MNSLQANPGKFQFMILGEKKWNSVKLIISSIEIKESKKVVLLGITIDNLLTFNEHADNLCRTANYKLCIFRESETLNGQFNYVPLVWMFCRNKQYLKIQKIHHRELKVLYNSNKNYDELLRDNNEVSIHQSHLVL